MTDEDSGNLATDGADPDVARRLLDKLSLFVREQLDDGERRIFAALLAPGLAAAHLPDGEAEVSGFQMATWLPDTLPEHLAEAVRDRDVRIEGL